LGQCRDFLLHTKVLAQHFRVHLYRFALFCKFKPMHPLGYNVYIIYGLCKKHLPKLGLRFFVCNCLAFI
jgi:hypothetical protein